MKISKAAAAREQKQRRKNLTKYIPNAAAAVFAVLRAMADHPAVGAKRRRLEARHDILRPVKRQVHPGVCAAVDDQISA